MMGKKEYQLFAEAISRIGNELDRNNMINFLSPIFEEDNPKYDEERFKEFISRRVEGKSLKGLNCNPKYLAR